MHYRFLFHRIAIIAGWVLFLLTNAFYGGALTMFFSSAPSLPFESARGGIRLHPDWKMLHVAGESPCKDPDKAWRLESLFLTGEELLLTGLAEAGDPDFQFYWQLANSEEGAELKQANYVEAMRALLVPGNFLFGAKAMSIDSVLTNKVDGLELHFLQVELTSINAILLPRGSPLTRMMNQGKEIETKTRRANLGSSQSY